MSGSGGRVAERGNRYHFASIPTTSQSRQYHHNTNRPHETNQSQSLNPRAGETSLTAYYTPIKWFMATCTGSSTAAAVRKIGNSFPWKAATEKGLG